MVSCDAVCLHNKQDLIHLVSDRLLYLISKENIHKINFTILFGFYVFEHSQPRKILLLTHPHLGCYRCINMFKIEIFLFAGG